MKNSATRASTSTVDEKSEFLSVSNMPKSSVDSPGSSVFDLPVYKDGTPTLELHSTSAIRQEHSSAQLSLFTGGTYSQFQKTEQQRVNRYLEEHSFLVISGGNGCNSICSAFGSGACYVLPVSDDGGSSSEIIRVLGGPSIGDIRSRLVRLIPQSQVGSPLDRIRNLLAYRLNAKSSERETRDEWRDIVEGRSKLWDGIPSDRKEVIRGFLVFLEGEILRRAQKNFSFRNGSIGNYFLAAALIFFRSLPSAIFLFSSITNSQANILPVLVTNHTVTIAAELANGRTLVGQCNISHPADTETSFSLSASSSSPTNEHVDEISEKQSQRPNLVFSKDEDGGEFSLESPISRVFYINAYGHEIHPTPNPDFIAHCSTRDVLVYSCGSLWTSVIPCLALKGVASAIARSHTLKAKILLLNSRNDRETGGYSAVDYINAITRTLNTHYDNTGPYTSYPVSAFVTHVVYLKGSSVYLDVKAVTTMGVHCVEIEPGMLQDDKGFLFDSDCVQKALRSILDS